MAEVYPMAYVTAPGEITFRDRELPPLGAHEVEIDVKAVTICGSDLHIFKGKHPAAPLPVPIGHEIAGQVAAVGEAVTRVRVGDRVAVEPVIACGTCHFCERGQYHLCTEISFQYRQGQGGLTPKFIAAERWIHLLPERISFAEGAMVEPLSVAVHAVKRSGIRAGDSVAVFGDGPIGLLIARMARLSGGREVYLVGVNNARLEKARALGATEVFHNRKMDVIPSLLDHTAGLGVDIAFEAVGIRTTLVQSLEVLKKGGTAVLVGLFEDPEPTVPVNWFVQKEIGLIGSQGYNWDFQEALKWLARGKVDLGSLITHKFPLSQTQEAFELLMAPDNEVVKIAIEVEV